MKWLKSKNKSRKIKSFLTKGILTISLNPTFIKEKSDNSKCMGCRKVIKGDMYRLWIMPSTDKLRLRGNKTDMVVCERCFGKIKFTKN